MELKCTQNMASLILVMSRRSIDLKWVHIQVQREIRYHIIITWRLAQKTEIMTAIAAATVLCDVQGPGGTTLASTPI